MGKIRSKKAKAKRRLHPTGLPSVRETEQQQALEGPSQLEGASADVPLLEKVRWLRPLIPVVDPTKMSLI